MRIACSTHENVDRGEVPLRPCVYRDMTFSKYNHARHTAIWSEMVEVTMQNSCTRRDGRFPKRLVNMFGISKIASIP